MTNGTYTHPNLYVNLKMRHCYGIKAYTQRSYSKTANIIIKTKKKNMHTDRCGNKWAEMSCKSRVAIIIQDFIYRGDTTNL